jgi:hypothetical protein
MKKFALMGAIALFVAAPLTTASAQLPSGNTGLGDARAQDQPTSRGIPSARGYGGGYGGGQGYRYGRSAYAAPYWRRHHRHHRHW